VVPSLSEMRDKSLSEFGALRTVSMERHARRPGVTLRRPGVTLRSGSSAWGWPDPGARSETSPGSRRVRNGYQVNCPVVTPDAIDLAVQLTQQALDKVRGSGTS